jgi:hypothetical protein
MDAQELETRTKIRFRRDPSSSFTYGKYLGIVKKDNSLTIVDNKGNVRSVQPEYVEYERKGPRGGKYWEPITNQDNVPE